jgi:restriction endonuclease Mrr
MRQRLSNTLLTPQSGDRGIDVIAFSETEVVLIQCKKVGLNSICQPDVLEELVDGSDYYREFVIPKSLKHLPLKTILVTTGKLDRATIEAARGKNIELVDGLSLRKLADSVNYSYSEIAALDQNRVRNIVDLCDELKRRAGSSS